jgi:hypothetical protein
LAASAFGQLTVAGSTIYAKAIISG